MKNIAIEFCEKVVFVLRIRYHGRYGYPVLSNVKKRKNYTRRALLVYEVFPFLKGVTNNSLAGHSRWWRNLAIVDVLDEMGYCVDVAHYKTPATKIKRTYDLMIGLQPLAFELAKSLPDSCLKVYITTGLETTEYNRVMNRRIKQIEQRHGTRLKMARPQNADFSNLRYFDELAILGNQFTANTFRPFFSGKMSTFNNHPGVMPENDNNDRDYGAAMKSFLYFASAGQIITGLDLLLDVFKDRPDLELYICSPFKSEKEFVRCFKDALYKTPNIHPVGCVRIGSEKHRKIVSKCGSVIVPQCVGASNGSVVACMHEGLVPIASLASGIDLEDFGVLIDPLDVDQVAKAVDFVAAQSGEWLKNKSEKTLKVARAFYSHESFKKRFSEIASNMPVDCIDNFHE